MIDSVELRGLIAELRADSDLLIVLGPPTNTGADSLVLASLVDLSVLVAPRGLRMGSCVEGVRALGEVRKAIVLA
jgi:Mrp family chromosome partitioning ATPase